MTPPHPHHLTAAEQIHRGAFAEMHVEETLDQLWPDLVGHIDTDHADNSLEIFFRDDVPETLACTEAQAKVIHDLGFHRFFLNFCDGTEQYVHEGKIYPRKTAQMPRGGSRSTLRPRLQKRVEELEDAVHQLQVEKLSLAQLASIFSRAVDGNLAPDESYPGKPIAMVEKVLELRRKAQ